MIKITKSDHPLYDQSLEMVSLKQKAGQADIILKLPDGSTIILPICWTDYSDETISALPTIPEHLVAVSSLQEIANIAELLQRQDCTDGAEIAAQDGEATS